MTSNRKIFANIVLIIFLIGFSAVRLAAEDFEFNMIFRYGIFAKNELDTWTGSYTKDMVLDPPVTVPLSLSREDLERIYQKMVEIDFFQYPSEFKVFTTPGEITGTMMPSPRYYFKVAYGSTIKELRWTNNILNKDAKADKLRQLIELIIDIIESKEQYRRLPAPRGGYQ